MSKEFDNVLQIGDEKHPGVLRLLREWNGNSSAWESGKLHLTTGDGNTATTTFFANGGILVTVDDKQVHGANNAHHVLQDDS